MENLKAEIIEVQEKKLIGKRLTMSFANNETRKLWQSFMPYRSKIDNILNTNLISLQIYPNSFNFEPEKEFEKWAAVEVSELKNIPEGLESMILNKGLYAVFNYKGSSTDTRIFQSIFGSWLPKSEYQLDNRPHFEVLGEKYKNNDPESEEEIWIPIKQKR